MRTILSNKTESVTFDENMLKTKAEVLEKCPDLNGKSATGPTRKAYEITQLVMDIRKKAEEEGITDRVLAEMKDLIFASARFELASNFDDWSIAQWLILLKLLADARKIEQTGNMPRYQNGELIRPTWCAVNFRDPYEELMEQNKKMRMQCKIEIKKEYEDRICALEKKILDVHANKMTYPEVIIDTQTVV